MFWMRNKKNNFPICTLIWRPAVMLNKHPNLLCQLVCIGFYLKDHASINLYFISIVVALDETYISRCLHFLMQNTKQSPGLQVIKLEYSLRLKIKRNDWLFADTCPQAANHCALSLRMNSSFITSRPDLTHALFRLTLSSANDWFCLSVCAT